MIRFLYNISMLVGPMLDALTKISLVMIILGQKSILKQKRLWIASIVMGLYTLLSYMITANAIRVILDFALLIICCEFILHFNKKIFIQITIVSFVIWVFMLLIDIFAYVILLYVFKTDLSVINANVYLKNILSSFVCTLLTLLFFKAKLRCYILKISKLGSHIKNHYILVMIILSVLLFDYDVGIILSTLFIMITVYTIIVIGTINEFYQKNKIQSEYDILLKNLNEYENLLDLQRVTNHENKNQLLVIKGMVDKGESNTSEYINSIIDTQYKDNDAIIYKTNRIPSGGLRGLIYYKILTMKEKKINSNLDVDRSLNELDFDNIPIKTNQELCKIVGVFLDNAIQAVSELKKKVIDIYLKYENDELYIKVSNNYSGIIELDKIDNSGYTTKGKGHGYGLSLVKGIIRENACFKNDREIHGKMFSQIIRLKINED